MADQLRSVVRARLQKFVGVVPDTRVSGTTTIAWGALHAPKETDMNRQSLFASATAPGIFAALGITVDAQPAFQTPGATWTLQRSAAGPPARFAAGMAYDESSASVLFFGGGGSLQQAVTYGGRCLELGWRQLDRVTSDYDSSGAHIPERGCTWRR